VELLSKPSNGLQERLSCLSIGLVACCSFLGLLLGEPGLDLPHIKGLAILLDNLESVALGSHNPRISSVGIEGELELVVGKILEPAKLDSNLPRALPSRTWAFVESTTTVSVGCSIGAAVGITSRAAPSHTPRRGEGAEDNSRTWRGFHALEAEHGIHLVMHVLHAGTLRGVLDLVDGSLVASQFGEILFVGGGVVLGKVGIGPQASHPDIHLGREVGVTRNEHLLDADLIRRHELVSDGKGPLFSATVLGHLVGVGRVPILIARVELSTKPMRQMFIGSLDKASMDETSLLGPADVLFATVNSDEVVGEVFGKLLKVTVFGIGIVLDFELITQKNRFVLILAGDVIDDCGSVFHLDEIVAVDGGLISSASVASVASVAAVTLPRVTAIGCGHCLFAPFENGVEVIYQSCDVGTNPTTFRPRVPTSEKTFHFHSRTNLFDGRSYHLFEEIPFQSGCDASSTNEVPRLIPGVLPVVQAESLGCCSDEHESVGKMSEHLAGRLTATIVVSHFSSSHCLYGVGECLEARSGPIDSSTALLANAQVHDGNLESGSCHVQELASWDVVNAIDDERCAFEKIEHVVHVEPCLAGGCHDLVAHGDSRSCHYLRGFLRSETQVDVLVTCVTKLESIIIDVDDASFDVLGEDGLAGHFIEPGPKESKTNENNLLLLHEGIAFLKTG